MVEKTIHHEKHKMKKKNHHEEHEGHEEMQRNQNKKYYHHEGRWRLQSLRKFGNSLNRVNFIFAVLSMAIALFIVQCSPPPRPQVKVAASKSPVPVTLSASSFNPSLKKTIEISIAASVGYSVQASINDAHGLSLRTISAGTSKSANGVQCAWDGKDDRGEIVPDEAYYVKITAVKGKDTVVSDPPLFSGGETFTVTKADVNLEKGTIGYTLDKDARIMIRVGEKKGIMLKSIVHCSPRLKGAVTEYWNGKDGDNLLSAKNIEGWALVIAGYTLPENSIVTYGNKKTTYRDYFQKRFPDLISSIDFPLTSRSFQDTLARQGREVNMHFTYPLSKDYAPDLDLEFPNAKEKSKENAIVLQGQQRMSVDIDAADKLFHRNQQFELCFFIDGKFVSEDEIGYVPYNWIWNTAEVVEGEHIVTVNLSSFKDQIGTKSIKVLVKH